MVHCFLQGNTQYFIWTLVLPMRWSIRKRLVQPCFFRSVVAHLVGVVVVAAGGRWGSRLGRSSSTMAWTARLHHSACRSSSPLKSGEVRVGAAGGEGLQLLVAGGPAGARRRWGGGRWGEGRGWRGGPKATVLVIGGPVGAHRRWAYRSLSLARLQVRAAGRGCRPETVAERATEHVSWSER